jgi:hypothetical protein
MTILFSTGNNFAKQELPCKRRVGVSQCEEESVNTIVEIAETIGTDFLAAVKAAENARSTAVECILRQIAEAEELRGQNLAKVRGMREQAADLISSSLLLEEQTEATYKKFVGDLQRALGELRNPPAVEKSASSKRSMRAIEGGRQRLSAE